MEAIGGVEAVTLDCRDPLALAAFWAEVFGTRVGTVLDDPPRFVDLEPFPGLPLLCFQRVPEDKVVKNRMHLDVSVADLDEAIARVEAIGGRSAGGTRDDWGYNGRIMVDPEGNEFCLLRPLERP
jgi:predicted enzyme related to lactoylglutathione lyase